MVNRRTLNFANQSKCAVGFRHGLAVLLVGIATTITAITQFHNSPLRFGSHRVLLATAIPFWCVGTCLGSVADLASCSGVALLASDHFLAPRLPMLQLPISLVTFCLLIGLFSNWRRAQKLLSEARNVLQIRSAKRTKELEKANEDLNTARAELQRRWQYLTEAQRLSRSGTFGWKVRSGELVWSDETYRILGFRRETNPTLDLVFDRTHPEDRGRLQQLRDRATQSGMALDVEHRILMPDGVIKYVHVVAHAGSDSSGNLEYMGVVTDITERKRAEEERQALSRDLRESKARLEEAQRVAHVGHYEWNLIANRVTWSDELYRIYGLTPQAGPIDMAIVREMIHPDDREHVFRAAEDAVRTGVHTEAEHRIVRPNGEVRTVQGLGTVKRDASGQAYEMFGTVQDITERKRAEEALQRSQFYLSEGQRLAHIGSWAFNQSGHYWSDELYKIYGLDPNNGAPTVEQYLALVHPQDRASMAETIKVMQEQHCGHDLVERIVRPDGQLRYVRAVAVPVVEQGVFKGFVGTTIDVTQQELLTQALRREQAYLAEAQSLTHTGSWACNLVTQQIFHSSDENARLYGFDPSQGTIPFERFYNSIHTEDEPGLRAKLEGAIRARTDYDVEFRICRPDRTIRFLRGIGHHNPSGEVGDYVGTTVDTTERKHAEEERERLRQLEADLAHINRINMMGELAASISHELKQPLTATITNARTTQRWLRCDQPDLEEVRLAAERIEKDGTRATEIIDRLRALYKKTPTKRQLVDVNEIIREMALMLRGEATRFGVSIPTDLGADLPKITAAACNCSKY